MTEDKVVMVGVSEYCEGRKVMLARTTGWYEYGVPEDRRLGRGRLVIYAENECGHNSTEVDLLELIHWVKRHRPDLLRDGE